LSAAPAQPSFVLNRLLARHPLVLYFVFAFGFSWLMLLPGLLMYYRVLSLSAQAVRSFAMAGLLGPVLSGFIMTSVIEGWPGISRLLRPDRTLARRASMVPVCPYWPASGYDAGNHHPAWGFGIARRLRPANHLGLSKWLRLHGHHRRTAV